MESHHRQREGCFTHLGCTRDEDSLPNSSCDTFIHSLVENRALESMFRPSPSTVSVAAARIHAEDLIYGGCPARLTSVCWFIVERQPGPPSDTGRVNDRCDLNDRSLTPSRRLTTARFFSFGALLLISARILAEFFAASI